MEQIDYSALDLGDFFTGIETPTEQQEKSRKRSVWEKMISRGKEMDMREEAPDHSYNFTVPSQKGGTLTYVRLTPERHQALLDVVNLFNDNRPTWANIAHKSCGLWGSWKNRWQTYSDLVNGFNEKFEHQHPKVKDRMGCDFSISQMDALDRLLNEMFGYGFDRGYK